MNESNNGNGNERLHALARAIAPHLGFEWAYVAEQPKSHLACFDGPDGSTMILRFDGYGANRRLAVGGRYPESVDTRHGHVSFYPRDDAPRITLAPSRPPHQMARDILRRFVPAYLAAYGQAVEQRQRCLRELAGEQQGNRRLAEALGLAPGDGLVRFYRCPTHGPSTSGHLETSLYGGAPNVRMELRGIPLEMALQIAALLAPLTKGGH